MKNRNLIVLLLCIAVVACKNKKQTLEDRDNNKEATKLEELYSTEQTLDTIVPNLGIKYKESRGIDPQHLPVVINIENSAESNELDVNQFYTQVEYVKLKHPLAEEGVAFMGNSEYQITFERGSQSGRGANSRVYLSENCIVAGDNFFGYHCFDRDGKYVYTIAAKKEFPEFDVKNNRVSFQWSSSMGMIAGFSMMADNCLITKYANQKGTFHFHNITSQKNYLTRPASSGKSILLSPDTYIADMYHPFHTKQAAMAYVFDIKGDTLTQFMNYNPLFKEDKGSRTNPENSDFYYLGKKLTMRQAYNDTIYRVSADKLTPAFVLNLGSKKPDVQTALKGDKKGKIFIESLLETDDFLFIIHTEDYDCPNNRNSGAVKFFYSYFDKKQGKRYSIPSAVFPEVFMLTNSNPEAIPLMISNAAVYKDNLYSSYTKTQLKEIMNSTAFPSVPPEQQEKLKSLHDEMTDYELLVMILKK